MSGKKALVLGGAPRVFLLPPEAALREKARGARRLSILLLVLVIVLVGAGYGYAFSLNSTAQASLTEAQAQSVSLVKQKKQYAKATSVAS